MVAKKAAVIVILLCLVADVRAIIPIPCANLDSLTSRSCCPSPDLPGAGPCGVNLGRGSCRPVAIPDSLFDQGQTDVRRHWPIQYFNSTCVCGERFGGFDCGECSYAYNDGTRECLQKTVLPRRSVGDMSDQEWNYYLAAVKLNPARYVVSTAPFRPDLQKLLDSTVRPTTYNLFIWMHYSAAKDNAATIGRT